MCFFNGEQEKIIHYSCEDEIKNPPLTIAVFHHSTSLVMPNGDTRDWFFYPTLTLMKDSYSNKIMCPGPNNVGLLSDL